MIECLPHNLDKDEVNFDHLKRLSLILEFNKSKLYKKEV